jgi:hypothetical protein
MTKATYRGPADIVEIDGIPIHKGEAVELTNEQLVRLRNSDPQATVEGDLTAESDDDRERIADAQAAAADKRTAQAAAEAEKRTKARAAKAAAPARKE